MNNTPFDILLTSKGLTLQGMNNFLKVCASGSIIEAAKRDPDTASLYSRQISKLSAALGVELLERKGRESAPTVAGRKLEGIIRDFVRELEGLRRPLIESRHFRIASSGDIIHWLIGPCLPLRDKLTVEIDEMRSQESINALRDGRFDAVVVRDSVISNSTLHQVFKLGHYSGALFVPTCLVPEGELEESSVVNLLNALPIAIPGKSTFRGALDEDLRRLGVKLNMAISTASFPDALSFACSGKYAALVPRVAENDIRSNEIRVIDHDLFHRVGVSLRLVVRASCFNDEVDVRFWKQFASDMSSRLQV